METKGRIDTTFYNLGKIRAENNNENPMDVADYKRLEKCWNVYFHGFNDRYDDIAYVKGTVTIEPGIYDVMVDGEECYLFLWDTKDEHPRPLKGLIARIKDKKLVKHAKAMYDQQKVFV